MPRSLTKIRMRECGETRALMSHYVDGELIEAQRAGVEDHLSLCQPCRTVLDNLRQTLSWLSVLRDSAPPGANDPEAVAERIRLGWRELLAE